MARAGGQEGYGPPMHHLTAADVDRLLPMHQAVRAARATALTVAEGRVHAAERSWHRPEGMPGTIGVMPAYLPDDGDDPAIFTTKLVGVFPDATPSVNGMIAVQDAMTGAPLATVDAAAVTAARTAAGSGLSIDLLARPDSRSVAVIGAGVQGLAHLRAAMAVRDVSTVRIWNRTPQRALALADRARTMPGIHTVTVHQTPGEAAAGADIVCVCTNSPTAVLSAQDISAGTHVTAIGAYRHDTRELSADLMAAADAIVVDDRDAASHEAGDVLMAIAEGALSVDAVTADLAQLVSGATTVDRRPADITVYKSVGTSAMDAVAVRHVLAADAGSRLAVYGTLAPGQANDAVLRPYGGTWARGTLRGRRLDDGWRGYPGLEPGGEGAVDVDVLLDATVDWDAVDAFEGTGYRRRRVVATMADGTARVVSTYVLSGRP